jgi:acyl carrier protein
MKISDKEIFSLIEDALDMNRGSINIESSNTSVERWDSLGHFAILSAIDEKYNDVSEKNPEIGKATSVRQLLKVLELIV